MTSNDKLEAILALRSGRTLQSDQPRTPDSQDDEVRRPRTAGVQMDELSTDERAHRLVAKFLQCPPFWCF
jgi:hypothetical protein